MAGVLENMETAAKLRELWELVKPPPVEEDESDTGSALYATAYHLFGVRLVLAILLMILFFTNNEASLFAFPHVFSFLYLIQSATFLILSVASLLVALKFPLKIGGTGVQALYFISGALSIAATVVDAYFYPALVIMFAHFSMAPKIRVRPWFIALPPLCHAPHVAVEILISGYHNRVGIYLMEMLGFAAAGVVVLVLTEMMKYAEFKQEMDMEAARSDFYSVI